MDFAVATLDAEIAKRQPMQNIANQRKKLEKKLIETKKRDNRSPRVGEGSGEGRIQGNWD